MGAGVAVPHDDSVAGTHIALLREDGVADTIGTDVEEVLDLVAMSPVPQHLALEGSLGVLGGSDVVDDHLYLGRIKDPVLLLLHQVSDGHWRGDFVTKNPVQLENPGVRKRLFCHVGVKNLLGDSLSHTISPVKIIIKWFNNDKIKSVKSQGENRKS